MTPTHGPPETSLPRSTGSASQAPVPRADRRWLPAGTVAALLVAVGAVALIAVLALRSMQGSSAAAEHATAMREQLRALRDVLLTLQDAETGQRGFLLTGEEVYLKPFLDARARLSPQLDALRGALLRYPEALANLTTIEPLVREKIAEMEQTVALRRSGHLDAALALVRSDRGRIVMDRIRELLESMMQRADGRFQEARGQWQEISEWALTLTLGGLGVLLLLIVAAAALMSREFRARELQSWLRNVQMALSQRLQGDQRIEQLACAALDLLALALRAPLAVLHLREPDGSMRRAAAIGLQPDSAPAVLLPGEGLAGQVLKSRQALHLKALPDDYLPRVGSSLGRARPAQLLLAPVQLDGTVVALLEFGFFAAPTDDRARALLEQISEPLAMALRAAHDRSRLEDFLEETQRQAEELQAQQEELKVSNEELEEQSKALRESQAQMAAQQAELEQTNAQLEEQAQALEHQANLLAESQRILLDKATELERASQYKSEFLANMSHELRTPLNSTLILAKLLADNQSGNLSAEQVRFAQTIHGAGNDLLALINDILDLARIEAGKVELLHEPVALAPVLETLEKSFAPQAAQQQLDFSVSLDPGVPASLVTDERRLGQILKNLLSNALKFTHRGAVALKVSAGSDDSLCFAVHDTGIGIAAEQQQVVFDAFQQADGSTHRKYGGTGLGLSISRNLAQLLGGTLTLTSAPGEGSVFTLHLPVRPPAQNLTAPRRPPVLPEPPARDLEQRLPVQRPEQLATAAIPDDRGQLTSDQRLVLVVEDDLAFAGILRDVAHEGGFQCVVTHSAGDALLAAERYAPSAVVLDMNLPDRSGLVVLDELKRDPRFRHVPVHVVSVADYSHEALARGAVGYALKPVRRETLLQAFARLDERLSQRLRRVLVIEDDPRQRDSIRALLTTPEVEVVAAGTAAIALKMLTSSSFDCVIMDLNLPDLSGYELLERMAGKDALRFPPVIVYTGRSLDADEEQRLRRFSRSIILKDVRSPERLLDEVTLFLHQVESSLPAESQRMLKAMRGHDEVLSGRHLLIVEDDVRNIFALSSVLEPLGVKVRIARNGKEALAAVEAAFSGAAGTLDLVLMDVMMPEMDGLAAMREIRRLHPARRLPIIALTAKAMPDDQEKCLAAGASDYIAKPLEVDKLLSLLRVWMPR